MKPSFVRRGWDSEKEMRKQLEDSATSKYHAHVFKNLNYELGNFAPDRATHLARQRFFWPKMQKDIEHYVTEVCRCIQQKKPILPVRESLKSITTSAQFVDFVHLERSSGGFEYLLVIMDQFTRYAKVYPTRNRSAKTERFNRKLLGMLRTLLECHKSNWNEYVNKMFYAYNVIKHDTTGYSQHFLLFGREPVLPIDYLFEERQRVITSYSKYVED